MSRRVEKLEHEVRKSRERLSATLDELRSRAQPSNLRQEGAKYLASTAPAEFVANLKADVLRNPVPLALLGVAVAWLASADRTTQQSASGGRYAVVWRWRARRLAQAAQQNASKALSTAQATRAAASELQQQAHEASKNLGEQLSRAPDRVRGLGQSLAKASVTRANAVADVTRTHPLLVATAAAGLAASAVGLALLYRRYADELDAASSLFRASEQEPQSYYEPTMLSLEDARAPLVPEASSLATSAAEDRAGFVE